MTRALFLVVLLPALAGAGDFVTNPAATLPGPKRDARSVPVGRDPAEYILGGDFNALRDAALDLKSYVAAPNAAQVTATGGTTKILSDWMRDLSNWMGRELDVHAFGAVGDGIVDDTAHLQDALDAVPASGATVLLRPGKTYIVDGAAPLLVKAKTRIVGYGATIKLKAGTYPETAGLITTRFPMNGGYDAGIAVKDGIQVLGLTLDGNLANVTATHSASGLYLYRVSDVLVRDVKVFNLPGTTGEGYGIITWYSTRARIENCTVSRTDRQNVVIWETTDATVKDCTLTDSYARDVLLVSTNTPPSLQASTAVISGGKFTNSLGNGLTDTHVVRFSGQGSGVVEDVEITGHSALDCIYITGLEAKTVRIHRNKIVGCNYGVQVVSDAAVQKLYDISDNEFVANVNGVRINGDGGATRISGNKFISTTTQPLYVAYIDSAQVTGNRFDGGDTNIFLRADEHGSYSFTDNVVANMTSATYSVNVGGVAASLVNVTGNTLVGNTGNAINHAATGVVRDNGSATINTSTATVVSNIDKKSTTAGSCTVGQFTHRTTPVSGQHSGWACVVGGTWMPLPGQATPQADSVAADVATLVINFNELLARLRASGAIAP